MEQNTNLNTLPAIEPSFLYSCFHSFYQHVFYLQSVSYPGRSNEELPRPESCEDFLPQSCFHLFYRGTEGKDKVSPTLVLSFGRTECQYIRTEVHEKYCFNTFSYNILRCFSKSSSYLPCFIHGQRISHIAASYLRSW